MDIEHFAAIAITVALSVAYAEKLVEAVRPVVKASPQTWDDKVLAVADALLKALHAFLGAFNAFKPQAPK
jgi:hypothetical protein